jgi:Arc/MetJ family transcription regulator
MPKDLVPDDNLLRSAIEIGRMRPKRETVNEALKEFIERRQQKRILDLAGTIVFRDDWDYKKDRTRE